MQVVNAINACIYTSHIRYPILHTLYAPYTVALNVLFPSAIMCVAYIRMGLTLYRSEFSSKDKHQAQVNLFQTCVLMVVMYTLSGLNVCIAIMLFSVGYYKDAGGYHYTISFIVVVFNQCINPFIYCIRYKEFQHQMKKLFCSNVKQQKELMTLSIVRCD